jgi:hypothetical protein
MKGLAMRRVVPGWGAAGVLTGLVAAAAIAAATAQATPNKPYGANVHQTLNTPGSFTLTLSNDAHASQSLGSANFVAPAGFVVGAVGMVGGSDASGFNVSLAGNVVQFRAKSSQTALDAGQTVSADVTVTAGITGCGSARWSVEAKQSNDFSGTPGNDLTLSPSSDLTPLGRFVFAPIETVVAGPDGPLHVPQIVTNTAAPVSITALDTCGNVDTDYASGTLARVSGLANASLSSPSWSGGVGTATITPVDVEVGDQLSVSDSTTGISGTSISTDSKPTFDVTQTICAKPGTVCTWTDTKKPITAVSTVPGDSNGHASLGLGYKPFRDGVTCGVGSPVGDSISIDPYQYTQPYTIVLTYAKSLVPKGPASSVVTCKSADDGATWSRTAIPPCPNTPVAPCAEARNVQSGALQITLHLEPGDPHTGGFTP